MCPVTSPYLQLPYVHDSGGQNYGLRLTLSHQGVQSSQLSAGSREPLLHFTIGETEVLCDKFPHIHMPASSLYVGFPTFHCKA